MSQNHKITFQNLVNLSKEEIRRSLKNGSSQKETEEFIIAAQESTVITNAIKGKYR